MKLKYILTTFIVAATLISCTNSDDTATNVSGMGTLNVEFDNAFAGDDLLLNSQAYTTSQNEVLTISTVKYIVSNIVLTKQDGTTVTYPKGESYFIVNESDESTHVLELSNIPAGNYTKIKFGIGVDQGQFNAGAGGQGDFLALAQAQGMLWSWSAGYKFVAFEGTFTSATVADATPFMVHTGQIGTAYNYTEITLNLPTQALVRQDITPQVHIVTDVSKFIDGTNKINLTANNSMGMGAMIMGGGALPLITDNLSGAFTVNHVHND
ncbi:MbnP family protein [Flavobacterium sp. RHBU_24]|uniref:MbnP family protein n=1 Tax=Flavobacterium sp. RHBU_24 TaxID=3391185 RepID=UPI0039852A6B